MLNSAKATNQQTALAYFLLTTAANSEVDLVGVSGQSGYSLANDVTMTQSLAANGLGADGNFDVERLTDWSGKFIRGELSTQQAQASLARLKQMAVEGFIAKVTSDPATFSRDAAMALDSLMVGSDVKAKAAEIVHNIHVEAWARIANSTEVQAHASAHLMNRFWMNVNAMLVTQDTATLDQLNQRAIESLRVVANHARQQLANTNAPLAYQVFLGGTIRAAAEAINAKYPGRGEQIARELQAAAGETTRQQSWQESFLVQLQAIDTIANRTGDANLTNQLLQRAQQMAGQAPAGVDGAGLAAFLQNVRYVANPQASTVAGASRLVVQAPAVAGNISAGGSSTLADLLAKHPTYRSSAVLPRIQFQGSAEFQTISRASQAVRVLVPVAVPRR